MAANRIRITIEAGYEKCQGKPTAPIFLTGREFYPIVPPDSRIPIYHITVQVDDRL